jgi:hypothetical protein
VLVASEPLEAILRLIDRDGAGTWSGDLLCTAAREVLEADGATLCLAGGSDHTVIGVDPASVGPVA